MYQYRVIIYNDKNQVSNPENFQFLFYFASGFGESSSVMLLGSFHAKATYLVWLPRANISPFVLLKRMDVYARVLPTSHAVSVA